MCTLQTLSSLVCRIAEALEPRETALQVKNSFDFYKYHHHHHHSLLVFSLRCDRKNGTAETMDMGMIMQAILKNGVGNTHTHTHNTHRVRESLIAHIGPRTESILKAIHQGVILTTAFEIKHKVTKSILTKDVRTKDGWRVHVHLAPNGAVVTHTRREMSIGTCDLLLFLDWMVIMFTLATQGRADRSRRTSLCLSGACRCSSMLHSRSWRCLLSSLFSLSLSLSFFASLFCTFWFN
jgi:hypothetical protein